MPNETKGQLQIGVKLDVDLVTWAKRQPEGLTALTRMLYEAERLRRNPEEVTK